MNYVFHHRRAANKIVSRPWSLVFVLAIVAIRLARHLRREFARASLGELYVLFTLALAHFRHI